MAERIKSEIADYLSTNFKIEVSNEKTVITNPSTKRCKFLGYDIVKGNNYTKIVKTSNGKKR